MRVWFSFLLLTLKIDRRTAAQAALHVVDGGHAGVDAGGARPAEKVCSAERRRVAVLGDLKRGEKDERVI